jgi:hypothetical protein
VKRRKAKVKCGGRGYIGKRAVDGWKPSVCDPKRETLSKRAEKRPVHLSKLIGNTESAY